ncbi:tail fibers protein [Synechococcus phage S-SBP1]|uniref:Tail fibers protein n=1 Tax=Synechococcus phage S-SBP1 TaxID=2735125 RepID=A0A6M4EKG1_9CAUD|nr:tail fibers protein [Synechococcus phage S-SBP1]
MTVKINGTNTVANPAFTGADTDTGLQCGTDELKLVTAGTSRATVDSSGRLLVGTSTARSAGDVTAQLQVEGTDFATSSLNLISNAGASAGNVPHISLGKSRGTSDGSSTAVADGDLLGKIQWCGADNTDLNASAASISAAVDGTPGGNDMPGRIIFATTSNSNDSPTERLRITSDGTLQLRNSPGIDFSQIQTNASGMSSETLDSYEEGTWTPAFTCNNVNFSYSDQSGFYTKIGNIVIVNFRLQMQSRTSGSGALNITGLPFSPTDSRCVLSLSPTFGNWGSNNAPNSGFTTGGDILLKKFDSSNAQDTQDTNVDPSIVSTAGIIGSMSYKIA